MIIIAQPSGFANMYIYVNLYSMKKDIHPTYYPNAKVACACGNTFEVGSTVPAINIEICSKCHPLFTGKQKIIDTSGRVERFKAREDKKEAIAKERKSREAVKTKKTGAKKSGKKKKTKNGS